jgi:hypothetical protein
MLTRSAAAAQAADLPDFGGVASRAELRLVDVGPHGVDAQVAAARWRVVGRAVLLHNGPVTVAQRRRLCLLNCGPRSVLTSFTAAEEWGLRRWERPEIHVAVAVGADVAAADHPLLRGLVLHRIREWGRVEMSPARRLHRLASALLLAAASFPTARPGCGLLAAAVQQRLVRPGELRRALEAAPRTRHRRALTLVVGDIEQGAEALSEIDFGRLCRRFKLPTPCRQAVRVGVGGRRRYLDAEWRLPDGRVLAVEVDGAHHMRTEHWIADQLRQNEIVSGGTVVLRFPSVVVRDRPELVAEQLATVLKQ